MIRGIRANCRVPHSVGSSRPRPRHSSESPANTFPATKTRRWRHGCGGIRTTGTAKKDSAIVSRKNSAATRPATIGPACLPTAWRSAERRTANGARKWIRCSAIAGRAWSACQDIIRSRSISPAALTARGVGHCSTTIFRRSFSRPTAAGCFRCRKSPPTCGGWPIPPTCPGEIMVGIFPAWKTMTHAAFTRR